MLLAKLAFRSLLRRKGRMALLGALVALGTLILVFGGTFAANAKTASRQAIVNYFTGDFIIYASNSKDIPSPFSFNTPLPVIQDLGKIQAWLDSRPEVEAHTAFSQNYGLIQVKKGDKTYDLPFIFYAVQPLGYKKMFDNVPIRQGDFFGLGKGQQEPGVVISVAQNQRYLERYGLSLSPEDQITLLSLTSGGSVNALPAKVLGIYEPRYYKNVFDYLNYMDMDTYSSLYNFTGVAADSLPEGFSQAMAAQSDEDIFALAGGDDLSLDTATLVAEDLTGYTMAAVKLKDQSKLTAFLELVKSQGWEVKTALWSESSSFFARIADILQGVILGITALIFLITAFILMNTQIINILERTGEIGTLRALGAEKSFVMNLFFWESLLLNGGAALVGMVLSLGLILWYSATGFALPEIMSQYLVGGGPLKLEFTPWPFITGFILVLGVSLGATLYPTRIAAGISPLKAMSGR